VYSVTTTHFVGDAEGAVRALSGRRVEMGSDGGRPVFEPVAGSDFELPCELVLLAMGFLGAERRGAVAELDLELDARGSVACDADWQTNREGVFVCGDMTRGQSLIVWAIAEGRSCASSVDRWLMGDTALPSPLVPGQLALR
jgi:glutamate synthase (NADPH/NADH) small chain